MSRNVYGIDFGTYEIKVYDKKQKTIWTEKNAVALTERDEIFAVGNEACEMYGKTPDDIRIVFPMKEGVIANITDMGRLWQNLLKKGHPFSYDSEYLLAVPADITQVERRAFCEMVFRFVTKAGGVQIVERGIADAVGAGLDIKSEQGRMILNLGGETAELSIVSMGDLVLSKRIQGGGERIARKITEQIKKEQDFLVGIREARALRDAFGICGEEETETKNRKTGGKNLRTRLPEYREIDADDVRTAMRESCKPCIREMEALLDRVPPEILRAVKKSGVLLTGGAAWIPGLSDYISGEIGVPVTRVEESGLCAVNGLKKIILTRSLRDLAYEMSDGNDRWMK